MVYDINHPRQRGDTLVEVLIAITIAGIIVAATMGIMNRMLVSMLNSAERTAVRAEMNGQAEVLNYIHNNDSTMWNNQIKSRAFNNSTNAANANNVRDESRVCTPNVFGNMGSFAIDISTAGVNISNISVVWETGGVFRTRDVGRATVLSRSIWTDAIYYPKDTNNQVAYYDFYIKACWTPLGSLPVSQSTTIVRIYD